MHGIFVQKRPVEDSDWRKNVEAMSGMEGRKKMFDAAKGPAQWSLRVMICCSVRNIPLPAFQANIVYAPAMEVRLSQHSCFLHFPVKVPCTNICVVCIDDVAPERPDFSAYLEL